MNNLKLENRATYIVLLLTTLAFFSTSCIKDEINLDKISNSVELDYGIVIPLAHGELNLKDIVETLDTANVVMFYPQDSLLYLIYKDEILSKKAEDFVEIPNQSEAESYNAGDMGFPAPVPGIAVNYSDTKYYDFGVSNAEEIDSMILKSGNLILNFSTTVPKSGNVKLIAPGLTKNGIPLQITFIKNTSIDNYTAPTENIDLTGYKLELKKNGVSPNQLEINYVISFDASGTISPANSVNFSFEIQNIKFSSLYGYISNRTLFNESGKIEMSVFDIKEQSIIEFRDPRIRIFTSNTYGVPFEVIVNNARTYSQLNDVYFDLNLNPTYSIASAKSITESSLDTFAFNRNNSNLGDAMATVPKYLYYDMAATSNPGGKTQNFITDKSEFKATMEVELPMDLKANRYEITDTMDFNIFEDIDDISMLKSITIYDSIENWFPFEAECQLILTDSNYLAIDTIYSKDKQPLIAAGEINANGRIIKATPYSDYEEFNDAEILKLKPVKYALFKVAVYTKNYDTNKFVKLYLTDRIKINLGLRAKVKITNLDQLNQ